LDNLTHTLVGIALSRAGFKSRVRHSTAALIFAANAPDIDLLWSWPGINYLRYHRGFTHSILALPLWTLLIAAVLQWLNRRDRDKTMSTAPGPGTSSVAPEGSWLTCLLLGFAGVGSHVLLDFSNPYGIRLFSPISSHWYAWNVVPIVDLWQWILLLFFLITPMLFALVGREVGERQRASGSPYRLSATIALALMLGWWGVRDVLRARALSVVSSRDFFGQRALSAQVFPLPADPVRWKAVVDLPDRYFLATVNASTQELDGSFPKQTLFKPEPSPAIHAAESSSAAQVFLQFARCPLASVSDTGEDTDVFFTDLRFAAAGHPPAMGVEITVNSRLRVLSQRFAWERQSLHRVAP
jgi:inner membrane protein